MALLIATGGVGAAFGDDTLLAAKLVAVKPAKLVKVLAKGTIPMPAAADDPTVVGAQLAVFDTFFGGAGADSYPLPAAGWKGLGNPAGSKGFKYKGDPGDPCRVVLLRPTVVKAICKSGVTLTTPFAGQVGVVLALGGGAKRYCATFGGTELANDAARTKRADAPAPASCATSDLGTHTCTLDDATSILGFPFGSLPTGASADGTISLSCGAVGLDGVAPCTCDVGTIAPIVFPSIGELCIAAAGSCPSGEIDCDGGDALGLDLVADHDIGACVSNADCATACGTVCSGLGVSYQVRSSGCEGFCGGGSNDDGACSAHSQCPGGACVGAPTDNGVHHAGRCNCQCGASGLGPASAAGTLTCNLAVRYTFEGLSTGVCGDQIPVMDTGPMCVPLTTAASTAVLTDANHNPGQTIPTGGAQTSNGAPISCASDAAGTLTGLRLVGAFGAFDYPNGDALARHTFVCQ